MEKILTVEEKAVYDYAIENTLKILESRIKYYDTVIALIQDDYMVEFEIVEELELMRNVLKKLKYNQEWRDKLWVQKSF